MAEKDKRYYWLKLKRDFFKRHDIQIIESMPNGKDYILFYLKLLCESVDHDGNLRFSEQIPYNEQMLATITNTNIDIVRSAIKIFAELKMMDIMDDGTYYMSEVNKMLGSETYWAQKKREQKQKALEQPPVVPALENVQRVSNAIPTCPSKSIDKEIELEKDKEIECKPDSTNPPTPPATQKATKHKYGEYYHVRLTQEEYTKLEAEYGGQLTKAAVTFLDEYIEMKGYKAKSHYLAIRKWVIDAVKERESKPKRYGRKEQVPGWAQHSLGDAEMENIKRMMSDDIPTAGNNAEIAERAEKLRQSLGG